MGARLNREKPKNTKKTLFRLVRYIGKSGAILVALMGIMIVVTLVEILNPFFQQKAIDAISVVDGRLTVDLNEMMVFLAAIGITFVFSAGLTYFQGILAAKLSQRTIYSMRNDLFSKISRLSISYTDSHRHGDIMSRMTNDVENVSNAVSQSVTTLFSAVLTLIGALVMMLYYSPLLTAVAVTIVPMTLLVSSTLAKFMRKYFVRQQRILGRINSNVEESVTGYKTVVAYGKEADAVASFAENAEELRVTAIKARVWGSIMGPIMNFLGNFHYVLLAAIGGYMVLAGKGRVTVGSIQAMLLYSKKFSQPINMIANQYSTILTALAGAERIFEIMDAADEIDEGKNGVSVSDIRGDISFEDLQFGYVAGEPVLKGFSLDVKAGQKIAIVGATGSGKTTVVNLLTRFYELDGGRITIDGTDITEIPKETLRRAIAIVLQDTVLFSDTIASNIRYGRESATDEDIRSAAKTAMADRFIDRLPEGYETVLAESGSNLSEGQRQLLAISRAVLADPKILILDEATSSVDTRTELRLQQAMNNLMEGRTSLIIAHRLSTIRDADKIVVVSDGRIVEAGSHEELLSLGGQYAKLYSSQFAGVAI
ncbi:MAG: ABC transporter ATP-binding protein [Clostridia bacterium]|nr:ABC transporter ATP-binding protein [Clostridia bacterium]